MQENSREPVTSLQMRFLVDQSLSAHRAGDADVADAFARAAEVILRAAFPNIADDIALAASRKGQGEAIGARLARHLDAPSAACVAIVLMLRGSRKRVVDVLAEAFVGYPQFQATTKTLCGRVFDQMPASPSTSTNMVSHPSIEVAAPAVR